MLKDKLDEALEEEQPDSSPDEETEEEKPLPFHEDPKVQDYISRQLEQGTKALTDKLAILEAQLAPKPNNEGAGEVPEWFGGNQKQWDAYQADRKAERELTRKELKEELRAEREAEEKRASEARASLESAVHRIEEKLGRDLTDSEYKDFMDYTAKHRFINTDGGWDYDGAWGSYSEVKRIQPRKAVRKEFHDVDSDDIQGDPDLEIATHDSLRDVDM